MSMSDPLSSARESSAPDEAIPDAIDHFWGALHEMLSAARSVLDAADAVVEQQRAARKPASREPRVRRIDVE